LKEAIGEYVRQQVYRLCQQKEEIEVLEMNVQPNQVHLVVSIPSKYAVSAFMGYLKGKLAHRLFDIVRSEHHTTRFHMQVLSVAGIFPSLVKYR
jgi:REP element-mobilizing transposase RayT